MDEEMLNATTGYIMFMETFPLDIWSWTTVSTSWDSSAVLWNLFVEMARIVNSLHENHVAHRDLHPDQFMIKRHATQSKVVLLDYGCANWCMHGDGHGSKLRDSNCGTAQTRPPEWGLLSWERSDGSGANMLDVPDLHCQPEYAGFPVDIFQLATCWYTLLACSRRTITLEVQPGKSDEQNICVFELGLANSAGLQQRRNGRVHANGLAKHCRRMQWLGQGQDTGCRLSDALGAHACILTARSTHVQNGIR